MKFFQITLLALGLSFMATPTFAEERTKLIYQLNAATEVGELGPEFAEKFPDKTADEAYMEIRQNLPEGTVVCVATKNATGMHFLLGLTKPDTPLVHVYIDEHDQATVMPINTPEDVLGAVIAAMVGMTHVIHVILPNNVVEEGVSHDTLVELLKPTREYLEAFAGRQ